jgi:molybdopterin/thiamine biosynthesis adenylyltransferase
MTEKTEDGDLDLFTREKQSNTAYEKIKNRKTIVAGCGNVGSVLATILAESGIPEIILIDFDDYSYVDNRQLYSTESNIGKNKAIATATGIAERVRCYVRPYNGDAVKMFKDNIIDPTGYDVFLCVDNVPVRKEIVDEINKIWDSGIILDVGVEKNAIQISNYKDKTPHNLYGQDDGGGHCVTIPLASFKAFMAASIMSAAYFSIFETEGTEDAPLVPFDHSLQIYTNTMTKFLRQIP